MKSTLKRFLSLVLCMCMVMALLPNVTMTAFAATSGTVTGLADENIGLSFTGDADDAWSANGTSIIGAATSTGGTCSDTSYKSTLTITNKKSTTATLSFDYSIEQNSGKIQVDGTEVSSGASFTKELATNESVKVYIQSGSTSAATKITLTNVVLVSDVNATATFVPAENGSYTVDGKLITEEYSNTQSSMTAYQVVATPADGYQFMGWYDVSNEKYISTSAKAALNIENDCTITARFASKTAALFETGGQRFDDLGDAVSYAQANSQSKITLATDGSISGTYTIPAGITLLIPFDEAGTLYTDAPAAIRTAPASKPFRTLTMSEGTSITAMAPSAWAADIMLLAVVSRDVPLVIMDTSKWRITAPLQSRTAVISMHGALSPAAALFWRNLALRCMNSIRLQTSAAAAHLPIWAMGCSHFRSTSYKTSKFP